MKILSKCTVVNCQMLKSQGLVDRLLYQKLELKLNNSLFHPSRLLGQISLKTSSVLIVGAGGLGCPAALYLAGAGVGCIGLVDYDYVELNNLHRQLLHVETSVGQSKAYSAAQNLRRLNSAIKIIPHHIQLSSENALDIIGKYSVVIDATDNLPTRYLLNDACVMLSRPLVSGSALQLEGQLTVYNYKKGPCYRCMFPTPPPPESVTNCGDGGVLGAVPGVIGVLQALEATKILLGVPGILSGRLLVFDAADSSFRSVYLRKRNELCCVCGDQPTITRLIDYEQFCRVKANDKEARVELLHATDRVSVTDYNMLRASRSPHVLVDVRTPTEFELCHIPGALNLPMKDLKKQDGILKLKKRVEQGQTGDGQTPPVFVVCRRGNDSQHAVLQIRKILRSLGGSVRDLEGGLQAWAQNVDPNFPVY
uniref:Adenylyltransferase and sulfurtransferase MOCS3 homolog n=1 Tax=Timema genevievae TaxID=629358 RepID=A0A7R9PQY5_TIMGE|nr:unnamed protein product [Timema genevievae]